MAHDSILDAVQSAFPFGLDFQARAANDGARGGEAGAMMPLEAAAKAIFVRANGLPAYKKTTGLALRATTKVTPKP